MTTHKAVITFRNRDIEITIDFMHNGLNAALNRAIESKRGSGALAAGAIKFQVLDHQPETPFPGSNAPANKFFDERGNGEG